MTEIELAKTLSSNIKKYRGKMTQEALAEKANVSFQLINGIEGCRKWVSKKTLSRIAAALGVEVYQLFIQQDKTPVFIEETPENEKIRTQVTEEVLDEVERSVKKTLEKIRKATI